MATENIVMLLVGIAFIVLGYLLITKKKVAEWGLSNGSGRIWAAMLGMERAKKLTKYFFGPLVILFGIISFTAAVIGAIAGSHH
ncbi:LPXTG cell wall anchor domain-containing protein [Granulicella sp. S156]|uniref:LPXTG cell wall anchor domain-containing protein n=1 Tax=Granulicella sp. S156 TaxID=1747224 RepID=UPI00131ECFB7|nr:LPXTG cell wall anchor domain-containing protein [Granulicella sp. S156]